MKNTLSVAIVLALPLIGCGPDKAAAPDTSPGVSWDLAQQRARTLADVRYDIAFTIPEALDDPILGEETIHFHLSDAGQPLVVDFNQPADKVLGVRAEETPVAYEVVEGHVVVPAAALHEGDNALSIDFVAGDGSLNRNPEFLYTLFVPDRARFAFPCFDQPNLKARYRLTLRVPEGWTAAANGPVKEMVVDAENGETIFRFAETKPISTYLFSFAAGRFETETAERGGRMMTMLHRETDADKVARNRDAIFDLHAAALDWLEDYTGINYPFDTFGFVLIPSFQYGGMEHPGAILYRQASLMLDASATQNQYLGRASLIAHETAHMWFGDLVTMNWFDDVWTKEVFANFMAAKIVNPSFPEVNHELRFLLAHYPAAYDVDRTEGANPIRQTLDNLQMAGTLYGAIIYQKAPIVMQHLERLVGEATFRDGLRTYLDRFRYANATWPDLIALLDGLSDEDLTAWSDVWVQQPGRPTIRTNLALDDAGRIAALRLEQSDPRGQGRLWTQQLDLLLAGPDTLRRLPVKLDGAAVEVAEAVGAPAPDFILANGRGVGYGLFVLDDASRAYLLAHLPDVADPLVRGVAWVSLWEAMLNGQAAPEALIDLAARALLAETNELNVQRILDYLAETYWRFVPPATRDGLAPRLETLCRDLMEQASSSTLKASYFNAFRALALTDDGLATLRAVWQQQQTIDGLPFSEDDYTTMAMALAVRGGPDAEAVLEAQAARITNPDRQARFAFVRPALSPDAAVRDAFFERLADEANRAHEPWVLDGLGYLHHPLRAAASEKHVRPGLELLEAIQRTGDIFFPKRWLDATLGGHRSPSAAQTVRQFLSDHPDLSPRLRGKVLQSADGLFRAAMMGE